jgi:hypothetical protein
MPQNPATAEETRAALLSAVEWAARDFFDQDADGKLDLEYVQGTLTGLAGLAHLVGQMEQPPNGDDGPAEVRPEGDGSESAGWPARPLAA